MLNGNVTPDLLWSPGLRCPKKSSGLRGSLIFSTAAPKLPRWICHWQRVAILPKAGVLWAALHPDTVGIIQDNAGKSKGNLAEKGLQMQPFL